MSDAQRPPVNPEVFDELVAALTSVVDFQRVYHENTGDSAPGNPHYAAMLMHVVKNARAALAKAEGR